MVQSHAKSSVKEKRAEKDTPTGLYDLVALKKASDKAIREAFRPRKGIRGIFDRLAFGLDAY